MHTSIEHLASCPACLRRTLHRRAIVLDEAGGVVSDERLCVVCTDRGLRSRTTALELQRPPRAPGKRPAKKRSAKNESDEEQSEEEQSEPQRRTRRGGGA